MVLQAGMLGNDCIIAEGAGFFFDTRLSGVGTSGCLARFIYGRKS